MGREPLEKLAKKKQLSAYKYDGFWYQWIL